MRTVRLGRTFDAVFIHDAIEYMTTEADLLAAIRTAFEHCRPGGVAIFVPDFVRETFAETTEHGGHDDGRRGLRYLEWTFDPNPTNNIYCADYAILLRDESGDTRVVYDRHTLGLFSRGDWLQLLSATGFESRVVPDHWGRAMFIAKRPI